MAMTKQEKATIISELAEKFKHNQNFYFADASGLTVEQINAFRRLCFEKGINYKMYKNTLIVKALEGLDLAIDISPLKEDILKGTTGILFSEESASLPAKIIREFRSKGLVQGKPILKGASIDSELYVGDENLIGLSELKSKEELIGDIIALLKSPAKNVMSALMSGKQKLAGIVMVLSEKRKIV